MLEEFRTKNPNSIFGHMAVKQTIFEEHPFFRYLEAKPSTEWLLDFIPRMAFWVMTFQDVLRLIVQRVTHPTMLSIARHIQRGDLGHDNWFLTDMDRLGLPRVTLNDLYDQEQSAVRQASYSILTEVLRAKDDRLLIVLLLALESASYVFFGSMTNYLENSQFPIQLRYFGRTHLDAEMQHGIVEAEMDNQVESALEVEPDVHTDAIALIDRIFDAFTQLFGSLVPENAEAKAAS